MWVSNQSIQNTIDYYAFGAIHETVTKNWNIPHYIAIRRLSPGYRAFNFNNINGYGLKFIGCSHQNDLPPNL